jgi:hypothetical protein
MIWFLAGMVTMWLIGRASMAILRANVLDPTSLGRRSRQKTLQRLSPDRFNALVEDVRAEDTRRDLL